MPYAGHLEASGKSCWKNHDVSRPKEDPWPCHFLGSPVQQRRDHQSGTKVRQLHYYLHINKTRQIHIMVLLITFYKLPWTKSTNRISKKLPAIWEDHVMKPVFGSEVSQSLYIDWPNDVYLEYTCTDMCRPNIFRCNMRNLIQIKMKFEQCFFSTIYLLHHTCIYM